MARKIFVSYKYRDNDVYKLPEGRHGTARDYVDYLEENCFTNDIYKGEGNEDLSHFKDETIESRLKDKIYDSSVTIVLISPNMKEDSKPEDDQWIPWEIAYSLKKVTRNDVTSQTNAILAVVLPDSNEEYAYFIRENTCAHCNLRTLRTSRLFGILKNNMFNRKKKHTARCKHCKYRKGSYIKSIEWKDFINDTDCYINKAISIRDKKEEYDLCKEV